MRIFGRVLLSLPGLVIIVALALVVEALSLVIAVYDAILLLLYFAVYGAIWSIRYVLSLPFAPIRFLAIRWAYSGRLRDLAERATNGFMLTVMFRVLGRLPQAVTRSYSEAVSDDYRHVPWGYRLLFLRLPGSRSTRRHWAGPRW